MNFLKKVINAKWFQHSAFWVLSIYVIGSYFSISNLLLPIDLLYALLFQIPLIPLVYLNLNRAIPKYLKTGRYLRFAGASIQNIGVAYLTHELVFEFLIPIIPEIYMVSFIDVEVLVGIFLIYFLFTTMVKLSQSWYDLQSVEREKLTLELNSLKSQINPHFLFNSLNSIYSLSLKNDKRTPNVILELSGLMRYILYEVADDRVPISKEIEIMRGYVDLQMLRADESTRVSFEVKGEPENRMIAPLLFLPLIENSFKHGVKGTSSEAFVDIVMDIHGSGVTFQITNNRGIIDDVEDGKFGGIGLENVKKRLNLIYPDSKLDIEEKENMFSVTAAISL